MDLQRLAYLTKCSLRVLFIITINIYCIPTYLVWTWVILLPLRLMNYRGYWYLEGIIYKWLLCMVASWSWHAQYYIMEMGDSISSHIGQRCLFIVNHQSTADVPLLMAAFQEKDSVLSSIMWIMDRMFRYTNFGAVSVTHGDYFITQGKSCREKQLQKFVNYLINVYLVRSRQWIVLFPEGGFLSKRKEISLKYAKANGFPILNYVTLPRIGAMHSILNTLHPRIMHQVLKEKCHPQLLGCEKNSDPLKWVIDVTIAYPEIHNPLDLLTICSASRPPCNVHIYYRCYPVEDVPFENMDALRDWVYDRWVEKEELLENFYKTGQFPKLAQNENSTKCETVVEQKHPIMLSNLWIGFLHFFFITSSFFHCYLLRRLCSFIF